MNRKVEQATFDRWCSQSVSSLSPSEGQMDERMSQVSEGSLQELRLNTDPEIKPYTQENGLNRRSWFCCCDSSQSEMKSVNDSCCEKNEVFIPDSIAFQMKEETEIPATFLSNQSIVSDPSDLSSKLSQTVVEPESSQDSNRRASFMSSYSQESYSRKSSIDDNGLGPFLTSLKASKRKVMRSSDFS